MAPSRISPEPKAGGKWQKRRYASKILSTGSRKQGRWEEDDQLLDISKHDHPVRIVLGPLINGPGWVFAPRGPAHFLLRPMLCIDPASAAACWAPGSLALAHLRHRRPRQTSASPAAPASPMRGTSLSQKLSQRGHG